jgi:hypothetical protein
MCWFSSTTECYNSNQSGRKVATRFKGGSSTSIDIQQIKDNSQGARKAEMKHNLATAPYAGNVIDSS